MIMSENNSISRLLQYEKYIVAQTQIGSILDLIDKLNDIDDETITVDEYDRYILTAEKSMEDLIAILNVRADIYKRKAELAGVTGTDRRRLQREINELAMKLNQMQRRLDEDEKEE